MSPAQPGGAARHRGDAAGLADGQDAAEVATGTMGRGAGRTGAARGHASRECTRGGGRGQEPDPRHRVPARLQIGPEHRSEEHTSELQSLMRISYAVFCLKKKKKSTK